MKRETALLSFKAAVLEASSVFSACDLNSAQRVLARRAPAAAFAGKAPVARWHALATCFWNDFDRRLRM